MAETSGPADSVEPHDAARPIDSAEPHDAVELADSDSAMPWRMFYDEARTRLAAAGEDYSELDARRIVEEASGAEPSDWISVLDEPAMKRGVAHFDVMLERRLRGEPLQYVLGRWAFRSLDLAVDARVLIPRPETEIVAGLALDELRRVDAPGRALLAADLGTGSGCIGLSLVAEHPTVQVVCTDASPDAIAATRANAAGLGRPAERIEVREGSWFEALPADRRGDFDVIVSNPPYVGADEDLPDSVSEWEPAMALVAGPTGFEHAQLLIDAAGQWLRPGGALVLELGATQLDQAASAARSAGFVDVTVHQDLAGRDRALVARTP